MKDAHLRPPEQPQANTHPSSRTSRRRVPAPSFRTSRRQMPTPSSRSSRRRVKNLKWSIQEILRCALNDGREEPYDGMEAP